MSKHFNVFEFVSVLWLTWVGTGLEFMISITITNFIGLTGIHCQMMMQTGSLVNMAFGFFIQL